MNNNGREVEFRQAHEHVQMWVERDEAPFDDYLCGRLIQGEDGYYRFHPAPGVVMHQKLLREAAAEVARLNSQAPNAAVERP